MDTCEIIEWLLAASNADIEAIFTRLSTDTRREFLVTALSQDPAELSLETQIATTADEYFAEKREEEAERLRDEELDNSWNGMSESEEHAHFDYQERVRAAR